MGSTPVQARVYCLQACKQRASVYAFARVQEVIAVGRVAKALLEGHKVQWFNFLPLHPVVEVSSSLTSSACCLY